MRAQRIVTLVSNKRLCWPLITLLASIWPEAALVAAQPAQQSPQQAAPQSPQPTEQSPQQDRQLPQPVTTPADAPASSAAPASTPATTASEVIVVTGKVVRADTGEPVAGAFVSMGTRGWSLSALSAEDGTFVIEGAQPGRVEVVAVADLFQPLTVRAMVSAGGAPLVLELSAAEAKAGEIVVVTGEAPEVAEPTSYEVEAADIRVLPGSGNDTLKSLQSLPGVARVPFGLAGLVLRGSSPRDSNVYLDGIEVPLLYHFGGLASFYPSSMLDSLELVPGAFSARFGRAQGGVVTMTSKPGRADRWRMSTEVSLTDASVRADGPGLGGGTWSLGLRRSYVDAVLAAVIPEDSSFSLTLAPRYYDGQVRYDVELAPGDRLSAAIFGSDDRLRFLVPADEGSMTGTDQSFDYVSSFARASLRWQRRRGPVELSTTGWVGLDESSLRIGEQGITRTAVPMGARADITRTFTAGYVSGGLDVQGGRFGFNINNQPPPMPGVDRDSDDDAVILREGSLWYSDVALWLEALYRIEDGKLNMKPGLRLERYGLTGEWVVDPRLNVSHELGERVTLKESLGIYHQPPIFADLDPAFGNQDLGSSYSVQATVGVETKLPGDVDASLTGFYDEMYDLPVDAVSTATSASSPGSSLSGGVGAASREFTLEQFGSYSYQENLGRGRNYGFESLIKASRGSADQAGAWLGWISYTYSRSLRRDDPRRYLDYRPYVLDQPHLLTALASVQLTSHWRFGARMRYATGNPITPVAGTYFDSDRQQYQSIAGELLSERLPAFFQLDLRLDRRWQRSWGTVSLFLDVQNVTNRVNAEGVAYNFDYTERSYTRGLPVFPSIGVEYVP